MAFTQTYEGWRRHFYLNQGQQVIRAIFDLNLHVCRSFICWFWIMKTVRFVLFGCKCSFREIVLMRFVVIGRFTGFGVAVIVGDIFIFIVTGSGSGSASTADNSNSGSDSDFPSIISTGEAMVEFSTYVDWSSFSGSNSNLSSTDVDDTSVFCGLASTLSISSIFSALKNSLG